MRAQVPQCDFKLGVTRIFLKQRAAQTLEVLHSFDEEALAPLVRTKVCEFWAAAGRISRRLLTYYLFERDLLLSSSIRRGDHLHLDAVATAIAASLLAISITTTKRILRRGQLRRSLHLATASRQLSHLSVFELRLDHRSQYPHPAHEASRLRLDLGRDDLVVLATHDGIGLVPVSACSNGIDPLLPGVAPPAYPGGGEVPTQLPMMNGALPPTNGEELAPHAPPAE